MEYSDVSFRSDVSVEIVDSMGGDDSVLRAMLVSTSKDNTVAEMSEDEKFGKISFLMKNRHGTPFEHASLQFYAEVPIFVMREWHRHRIGVSYNEMSGRYTQLPPTYYIPAPNRNLVQVGKPGAYTFIPGEPEDHEWLINDMMEEAIANYARYENRLAAGIAKEVARMSLGVNIFTAQYFTTNPRSLMAFLSLRTNVGEAFWLPYGQGPEAQDLFEQNPGGAMFPSFPMREIEMAAEVMELEFEEKFPLTYAAFKEYGRVCP